MNVPALARRRRREDLAARMLAYALRRIAVLFPTLLVVVTLSFIVIRLAPGGPFDEERSLPPEIKANLQAAYGLDQPLTTQYVRYVRGLHTGSLGPRSSSRTSR